MENNETTKDLQTLEEMGNGVRKLTKFEQTAEGLKAMVAESQKIKAIDLTDPKQLEAVKRSRIDLRNMEIDIEKRGKGYRDVFTSVNKEIKKKEDELKLITGVEIDRLKGIEERAEKLALLEKRKALLPARKERLTGIDASGCYICADEYLLIMDAGSFETYFNHCMANKNERTRLKTEDEAEAKRKREQEQINLDRMALEADIQKEEDRKEDERKQKEEDEKKADEIEQYRRAGLLPERRKKLEAIGDNVPALADDQMLTMDDNAYTTYYNNRVTAKNTADNQAIEDKKKINEEEIIKSKKNVYRELMQTFTTVDQCDRHKNDNEWGSSFELDMWQERRDELVKKEEKNAELEKKEAYKKFLKEHGYTAETRDQFETREVNGDFELWKKVGVFTK